MTALPVAAAAIIFPTMLMEARISARHERTLRAMGAVEPEGDVYAVMQVAYPGVFLAMLGEGLWRGGAFDAVFVSGLAVFGLAKILKYWAIVTLGTRWTFRVLVPPVSDRVTGGPYRWLNHPNYLAVAGEMAGTALAMHAWITGPAATVAFILIMRARVGVEERALRGRSAP